YKAIGRELANRGELQRPVTMPAIREKLAQDKSYAQEIMNWNPAYVFFRRLPGNDVIGAQGVGLTPKRSLAVDPHHVPLGAPVWLDTTDGKGESLKRLMIAQDTGGAIKGAVRGDFFWGAGEEAAQQAGSMQNEGRAYVLLPKGVTPDDK
ncbi:MAG: MltA domain-containing protein, partial [Bdellovibrionales bacterium]